MRQYAVSFGIAFAASVLLTLLVRTVARRFGMVAKPRPDRWHQKPTALFGGIGIFGGFMVAHIVAGGSFTAEAHNLVVIAATGLFITGLVDDFVQLKPYAKLILQIIFSTLLTTTFGLRLGWLPSQVLDSVLTILWLVGITNGLNLLDNIDGLAGGIAAIGGAFLVYFCHISGVTAAATLGAAFCGAVVGFLVFNFNPASIFMGDCGSLFLGFFLGALNLLPNQGGTRRNVIAVLSVPVLLLLLPIVDTTLVTISRKLAGRAVSQGGRDHTSHRLVALGLSERAATLTLWAAAAASGGIAVAVRHVSWSIGALLVPVFGIGVLFLLIFVGRVRVYEPVQRPEDVAGRALLPTLADFTYKRRIFEVLNDLTLIVMSYYAAFLLRFDGDLVQPYYATFLRSLPLIIVTQLAVFLVSGLYRGLWRYTSVSDLTTMLGGVFAAWLVSTTALAAFIGFTDFSRGVVIMQGVLLAGGIAGTRVSFRILRNWVARFQSLPSGKRVLIYGAGDGGELLLRELQNNRDHGLVPVGFLDDDPQKQGRVIHGVRVLGTPEVMLDLVRRERVEEIVISTAKLAAERSAAITTICQTAGLSCRRLRISLE